MMPTSRRGVLRGNLITLDTPIPVLEGRRVLVSVEPAVDDEPAVSAALQAQEWREWVESGPQGPLNDETEVGFP
jgi:hypothetical protein